jgi:peroxiredoxin
MAAAMAGGMLAFGGARAAAKLAAWGGKTAPPLALKDIHGGEHDLSRYRGKVVLVNFWATWCEPCRYEMPSMQRLKAKLADKSFELLAVNVDEPEARVRRFVEETRFDLPVLLDVNKRVTRAWGVRVMPTTFLVGPDGRIRYRAVGDLDWSSSPVISTILQLLTER